MLNLLLDFADVDGNLDVEDADQASISVEHGDVGCAELFALQVKRAIADWQHVDNFVRSDNRLGKWFFERNGARLVDRDGYMVQRNRSCGRAAAERIIDADFRCIRAGDGDKSQQGG